MSRISDPKWREPPNQAYILVLKLNDADAHDFWDWCYGNCKAKVIATGDRASIVLDQSERNDNRTHKYHNFSYGDDTMVVLIENAEDAMLIKLTWGGM